MATKKKIQGIINEAGQPICKNGNDDKALNREIEKQLAEKFGKEIFNK